MIREDLMSQEYRDIIEQGYQERMALLEKHGWIKEHNYWRPGGLFGLFSTKIITEYGIRYGHPDDFYESTGIKEGG